MEKHLKQLQCLKRMIESAQWAQNAWLELGEIDLAIKYREIKNYLRDRQLSVREKYFARLDSDFTLAKINDRSDLMADIINLKLEWI